MHQISKIGPNQRQKVKPGVFSNHSVLYKPDQNSSFQIQSTNVQNLGVNRLLTHSVDVNTEALQTLNQQVLSLQKKSGTPIKPKHVATYSSSSDQNLIGRRTSSSGVVKNQNVNNSSLLDKFNQFQQDKPNDMLHNLLEQQIVKTKRNLKSTELQGVVVPNLYQFLEGKVASPIQKQNSRKTARSNSKLPKQPVRPNDPKNQKNITTDPHRQTVQDLPKQVVEKKKLNFNIPTTVDQDDQFLQQQNKISDLLIEHVLNKDDYYDKIKQENQAFKESEFKYQKVIADLTKNLKAAELKAQECQQAVEKEREKYQGELLKLSEKLNVVKNLHSNFQQEKQKNEEQQIQLKESQQYIHELSQVLVSISSQCVVYLEDFQQNIERLKKNRKLNDPIALASQLLKHSLHLVFQTIQNTQQLSLTEPEKCRIPENVDFETFFQELESNPQITAQRQSESIHGDECEQIEEDSINDSQEELSFRQRDVQSISLVRNTNQPSKNVSLQEQFNTFLEEATQNVAVPELGSPYFTNSLNEHECDMPLQMRKKQSAPTENAKELQNFQTFKGQDVSENEIILYDTLFKEMSKTDQVKAKKSKTTPLHTLKYFDQQVNRNEKKQGKESSRQEGDKENIQVNPQKIQENENKKPQSQRDDNEIKKADPPKGPSKQWGIAKFNYKAQKENDLTFQKGDKIEVQKQTKNGWWIGVLNGKVGYFPYNFVQLEEEI